MFAVSMDWFSTRSQILRSLSSITASEHHAFAIFLRPLAGPIITVGPDNAPFLDQPRAITISQATAAKVAIMQPRIPNKPRGKLKNPKLLTRSAVVAA